jgi:hypothetical protein
MKVVSFFRQVYGEIWDKVERDADQQRYRTTQLLQNTIKLRRAREDYKVLSATLAEFERSRVSGAEAEIRKLSLKELDILIDIGQLPPVSKEVTPKGLDFVLCLLLTREQEDAVLGDLAERFDRDVKELGPDRARRRYYGRGLRSLLPLLWRMISRGLRLAVFADFVRRFFI